MQLDAALYIGAEVTIHTADRGDVAETVMLPHFKVPGFAVEYSLPQDIAELLCLDKLRRRRRVG